MPYLDDERKKFVDLNPDKAKEEGDMNYIFTLGILNAWKKTPRYKTIHHLRKACFYDASVIHEVWAIEQRFKNLNVHPVDINVAKELAFNEFYRRVGAKYEDKKIKENGDVYPDDMTLGLLGHPVDSKIGEELKKRCKESRKRRSKE